MLYSPSRSRRQILEIAFSLKNERLKLPISYEYMFHGCFNFQDSYHNDAAAMYMWNFKMTKRTFLSYISSQADSKKEPTAVSVHAQLQGMKSSDVLSSTARSVLHWCLT